MQAVGLLFKKFRCAHNGPNSSGGFANRSGGANPVWLLAGDTGLQVTAGLNGALNDSWYLNGGLRQGSLAGIDASRENNTRHINDLDYSLWTVGLGLQYNF